MADRLKALVTTVCLPMLVVVQALGFEAVIEPVGYSPQEVRDLGLATQRAMPLKVIGVGQPVYLESVHEGTYSWALTAPEGSSTTLSSTTEREVYLIPDTVGSYVVTLDYTDPDGATSADTIMITGGYYVGVDAISGATSAPVCSNCHLDKKSTWEQTGHAGIMQRGLDGTASLYYEESCLQCHTVGYDTLAVNGGFDDRAAVKGWRFPDSLYMGVYDEFVAGYPQTAQLANVQCESCHGPGSRHGIFGKIGLSYDSGVCDYCHDEQEPSQCGCQIEGSYYFTEQWKNSSHGIRFDPEEDFNSEGNDCVPCHTAEGFFEVNVREDHQSAAPYRSFHGITCALCHDPHNATGENQLRIVEDYLSRDESGAAKYKTEGTPATACDVCHHLCPDTEAPGSRPHYSHQTDILNNQAGYRYPGREYQDSNVHSLEIQGRCVGCHMAYAPGDKTKYVGSHTFAMFAEADPANGGPAEDLYLTEACIACHGDIGGDFDYHGIQTRVARLLEMIKARLVLFGDEAPDSLRGCPRYSQDDVDAGIITEQQKNASYNWYIFHQDGSRGIHNPGLSVEILEDALEDLGGIVPGPVCDLNEDGRIDVADAIALLLFQRANPDDPKGDINGDGSIGIADAIFLLIHIMEGTCTDASVLLAAENSSVPGDDMLNLSRSDIEYIEKMMSMMDLTEEEEAAFRMALYGQSGVSGLPKTFALGQNSPNPFNPATTISYNIPEGNSVHVRLELFDIRGKLVRTLVDEVKQAGSYNVFWDGTDQAGRRVASGVYLYRMRAGDFVKIRKMVLLK